MKIDMKRTTTYMTTKKRIGCRAPNELLVLVFMIETLGFSKNWISNWICNGKITDKMILISLLK